MTKKDEQPTPPRKDEERDRDRKAKSSEVVINCPNNSGTVIGHLEGDWHF